MTDSSIPKPKNPMDRRPLNIVIVEGTVCLPPQVSVSKSGRPLLKVCLSVLRPQGVPRKMRPDGSEDPDYPWFALEGEAVAELAPRVRKGDRLYIRGAITTRNVAEKQFTLNGDELQDLQALTNILTDYLNGVAPDVVSVERLRELVQEFAAATQQAETRKRVVTEVAVTSVRVLRDQIAPGEAIDLTASARPDEPGAAPEPLTPPWSQPAPAPAAKSAPPAETITRNQRRNQKKKKKRAPPPPPPLVVYESDNHHDLATVLSGLAQAENSATHTEARP